MGTTTKLALPYPEPTDPVAAGADAIKALANAVDPLLSRAGGFQVGYASTNIIQNVGLSGTTLNNLSATVALAAGRRYRAEASVVVRKRGAAGIANLYIVVGAQGAMGGALDQIGLDEYSTLFAISKPFVGTGNVTISLQGLAGSGSVDYTAATFDSILHVFDIGGT